MAPNLITLLALVFTIGMVLMYAPFDPTLTEKFPPWTFYMSAFCLFMYQTLDAIDGKQARRT
jgi:ethanolaminephosphotransferase